MKSFSEMYYQHVTFYAGGIYIDQPNAALRIIYYHPRRAYDLDSRSGLPWASRETEWLVGGAKYRICWNYAFSTARQLLVAKSDIGFFNLPSHMGEKKIEHCIRDPRSAWLLWFLESLELVWSNPPLENLNSIRSCSANSTLIAYRIQKTILGSLHLLQLHRVARTGSKLRPIFRVWDNAHVCDYMSFLFILCSILFKNSFFFL